MSGIYIKNMKMPAEPGAYEIRLFVREDGTASCWGLNEYIPHEPLEVIPVPERGRLVDADKMLDRPVPVARGRDGYFLMPLNYAEEVRAAPTVIPADEEGET